MMYGPTYRDGSTAIVTLLNVRVLPVAVAAAALETLVTWPAASTDQRKFDVKVGPPM